MSRAWTERMPEIEILHTPGCGNTPPTEHLVHEVATELACSIRLIMRDVTKEPEAMVGFAGSPTVLVDGIDLEPGALPVSGFG
jgi:hypothetical protein